MTAHVGESAERGTNAQAHMQTDRAARGASRLAAGLPPATPCPERTRARVWGGGH